MDEIRLPQHVMNCIDRRWAAKFGQMAAASKNSRGSFTRATIRFDRCALEGSLTPPATERNWMIENAEG
jgi:hypothetical protein